MTGQLPSVHHLARNALDQSTNAPNGPSLWQKLDWTARKEKGRKMSRETREYQRVIKHLGFGLGFWGDFLGADEVMANWVDSAAPRKGKEEGVKLHQFNSQTEQRAPRELQEFHTLLHLQPT